MKAMVETCFASRRHAAAAALPLADGKVHKLGGGSSGGEAEMQALFLKLKELVPVPAGGRKMSRTEILQCVIDYIFDLEVTLESHPLCQAEAEASASDGHQAAVLADADECCDVAA